MKIGNNIVSSSGFNANPRTGTPMPKLGVASSAVLKAPLPRRSRGGGAGDPLGGIPAEMRAAFQALKAPRAIFTVKGGDARAEAVLASDHAVKLQARGGLDGDITFYAPVQTEDGKTEWERVSDDEVLFLAGEDLYTGDGVEAAEEMDRIPVEGTPDELNKLYTAIQKFNKATGKNLRMLLDRNVYDDNGVNIMKQVKVIWRVQ